MKQYLTILFALTIATVSYSQTHLTGDFYELGVTGGVNTLSFGDKTIKPYYKNLTGHQAGISFTYNFNHPNALIFSVLYGKYGYRFNPAFGGLTMYDTNTDTYIATMTLPLLYTYRFTWWRFQLGAQVGLVQKAIFNSLAVWEDDSGQIQTMRNNSNVWHSDIATGVLLNYSLWKYRLKLSANFIYSYTFAMVNPKDAFTVFGKGDYPHPNSYLYSLGINYTFGKREINN
ncbi:MAG: PorT family protein [Sphingobacteriales bacterium JAD_PAG50586_3]|nr:MAG: PorT family protein [Sphingobacteriales bacterium JAD_PAG50586_3]